MKVDYIIIHHTGAEEKNAAQVKRYHLGLGWRDIGYHFVIERSGLIVAGRTGQGAHCTANDMNTHSIGIALIGDFTKREPTKEQLDSLFILISREGLKYDIPCEKILGHKEVKGASTACPGNLNMVAVRAHYKENKQPSFAPSVHPSALYRVQVGAFRKEENAQKQVKELKSKGINALIKPPYIY